jgi:HSP20 family molecular chaperone IbpA
VVALREESLMAQGTMVPVKSGDGKLARAPVRTISERSVRSFYRSMPVPTGVTAEQIQASLKDGVLEVKVPKPAEAKTEPHTVPVT